MRDLAVVLFFAIMLYLSMRRPAIGLAVWFWTAFIAPNHLIYGFADGLRFNMIAALATIVTYFFYRPKPVMAKHWLLGSVLLFFVWTCISSIFSIYDSPIIFRELDRFFRGIVLFMFALLILDKKEHFNLVSWAIVLSIGFYSGVEGLKYISSGGGHHIFGPTGTNMRDNNHLALAINMMLPFSIYLLATVQNKFVRMAFIGFLAVSVLCIVGTNSRGGFVGLMMFFFSLFLVSKRKILLIVLALGVGTVVYSYIPDSYFERIESIENAETDSSFLGRVVAWKQSVLIALDNPLTGGGFYAVQTYKVWQKYAMDFDKLDFIETPHASLYNFKAAHSIYFQVLGDQGIAGLIIYLVTFIGAGLTARRLSKLKGLDEKDKWIPSLAKSCFMSLLLFGVCGGLLSLAYFEFAFFNIALVIALNKMAKRAIEEQKRNTDKSGETLYVTR